MIGWSFLLIPSIIKEFHSSPIGGHLGESKTYQRVAAELYWVGMRRDIAKWVRGCITCQQHPSPLLARVWDDLTMDFIEGLPKSETIDTILVVVDRLSKYAHFIGIKHPYMAVSVADIFIKNIVKLRGIPQSVFMSHFWCELFKLQGA